MDRQFQITYRQVRRAFKNAIEAINIHELFNVNKDGLKNIILSEDKDVLIHLDAKCSKKGLVEFISDIYESSLMDMEEAKNFKYKKVRFIDVVESTISNEVRKENLRQFIEDTSEYRNANVKTIYIVTESIWCMTKNYTPWSFDDVDSKLYSSFRKLVSETNMTLEANLPGVNTIVKLMLNELGISETEINVPELTSLANYDLSRITKFVCDRLKVNDVEWIEKDGSLYGRPVRKSVRERRCNVQRPTLPAERDRDLRIRSEKLDEIYKILGITINENEHLVKKLNKLSKIEELLKA